MELSWNGILLLITIVTATVTFFVSLINVVFNSTLKEINNEVKETPKVSVLIPMRNEEKNIPKLLNSLIEQSYNNIEILILDDNSTDNSYEVASNYSHKIKNLRVLKGSELPNGWLGKNWACHQLSQHASGELLAFVDADVILAPKAIEILVNFFYKYKLDALSVFPTQIMNTFGEKLVVPLMNWILLSFLPLILVRKSHYKSLTAANGQVLMFKKEIYHKIGGHTIVSNHPVEDMELAKLVKLNGFRIATFLGGGLIKCNMYNGFSESIQGYSKNFFKGFNINWLVFILFMSIVSLSNIIPFLLILYDLFFIIPIFLILLNRILVSYLSKQNIFVNLLLHLPQFIVFLFLAFFSVYKTKFRKNVWKGRPV